MAAHRVAVLLVVFLVVVCSADGGPLGCCGGVAFLAHGCYPAIMMPELMAACRVAALLVFCSVDGGPLGRHHDGVHYHPNLGLCLNSCLVFAWSPFPQHSAVFCSSFPARWQERSKAF